MENVRFAFIPPDVLSEEVVSDEIIDDNKECRKIIAQTMKYHANLYTQPFNKGPFNKLRGLPGLIVIPNGTRDGNKFSTVGPGEEVHFVSFPILSKSVHEPSLKTSMVAESMTAIEINNFLYVFGSNCQGFQNFTKRYDASTNVWSELAAVPREAAIGVASACFEGKIFLFGGHFVHSDTRYELNRSNITDTVYMYDIGKNVWSQCSKMPMKVMYTATAELHGNIYVTGGYTAEHGNILLFFL